MTIIHDAIARHSIRRRYWRLSTEAGECNRRLYTTGDPIERAELLDRYAAAEAELADLHPLAFGADPNPYENGRDHAESLASSAELARLLAATERALITHTSNELDALLAEIPDLEVRGWQNLALIHGRATRAQYIEYLADLVVERVGGQAAETLYEFTRTEHELAAAAAEGREPREPWTTPRWAIAALLTTVGAAILFPAIPGISSSVQTALAFASLALLAAFGCWAWRRERREWARRRGHREAVRAVGGGEGQGEEVRPSQ